MIAMGMMKVPFDQVVHMIPMRYSFVAAPRSMHMARIVGAAAMLGCASVGVGRRHFNRVFIDVVAMHMVQMSIMQVIDMPTVADGRMAAIGSVDVWVVAVFRIDASCHDQPPATREVIAIPQ